MFVQPSRPHLSPVQPIWVVYNPDLWWSCHSCMKSQSPQGHLLLPKVKQHLLGLGGLDVDRFTDTIQSLPQALTFRKANSRPIGVTPTTNLLSAHLKTVFESDVAFLLLWSYTGHSGCDEAQSTGQRILWSIPDGSGRKWGHSMVKVESLPGQVDRLSLGQTKTINLPKLNSSIVSHSFYVDLSSFNNTRTTHLKKMMI